MTTATKRTLVINLRVTADEKEQIEENAKAYEQSVSDFLRKQATLSELDLEPIPFFDRFLSSD